MTNATRTDTIALRNTVPRRFTAGEVIRHLPELTFRQVGKRPTKINGGFANKMIAVRVCEFVLKSAAVEWRGSTAVSWRVGALTLAACRSMCPTSQGAVTR